MNARLNAVAKRENIEIYFREDFGTYKAMLQSLEDPKRDFACDWLALDADEFNRHSLHAMAKGLGIEIATKKHKIYSAYIILRVK